MWRAVVVLMILGFCGMIAGTVLLCEWCNHNDHYTYVYSGTISQEEFAQLTATYPNIIDSSKPVVDSRTLESKVGFSTIRIDHRTPFPYGTAGGSDKWTPATGLIGIWGGGIIALLLLALLADDLYDYKPFISFPKDFHLSTVYIISAGLLLAAMATGTAYAYIWCNNNDHYTYIYAGDITMEQYQQLRLDSPQLIDSVTINTSTNMVHFNTVKIEHHTSFPYGKPIASDKWDIAFPVIMPTWLFGLPALLFLVSCGFDENEKEEAIRKRTVSPKPYPAGLETLVPTPAPTSNRIVKVYHGTRLPLSVIVEHGIPALSNDDRKALFGTISAELQKLGLPAIPFSSSHLETGVYVTDKYSGAETFAKAAPDFVSDRLANFLGQLGYTGKKLDYILLAILDKVGQPKIVECNVPLSRFVSGAGAYGSILDCILPSDIIKVHIISYAKCKQLPEKAVENLLEQASGHWEGTPA